MSGAPASDLEREIVQLAEAAHQAPPAAYRAHALATLDRLLGIDVGMTWSMPAMSAPTVRGLSGAGVSIIGSRHAVFVPTVARLLDAADAGGGVVLDRRVFTAREMAEMPLYNELGGCMDLRHHMTIRLAHRGRVVSGIYLGRGGARARPFSDDDLARVRRLVPVLSLAEAGPPPAEAACLTSLTVKEREVLDLFAVGATYAEVGRALGVSINTIRQHVRSIYDKLHVASKTEAVMRVRS